MNTQNSNSTPRKIWLLALPVSLVMNGLMFGLLLSGVLKPETVVIQAPQTINDTIKNQLQNRPQSSKTLPEYPRRFMRALPVERRKQVMVAAYKSLNYKAGERPRQLLRQLRRAERHSIKLLKSEDFDLKAIEKSLAETREIKHKLAISGDAMIIEVLNQLTPKEREDALLAMQNQRHMRRQRNKRSRQ
ncbi:MAG: hypothetical protein COA91_13670 [Robiginitomaculum sp.]|nr:MAG: hypothetical protein COA91_13670 [Robiginitomaculum sp.]